MKTTRFSSLIICLAIFASPMMAQVGSIFGSQQSISTSADGATDIFAADLDGDGDEDVISCSFFDDKIAWYENLGGSFSGENVLSTTLTGPYSVYAADIDGDGDQDILTGGVSSNSIQWIENLGGGTFGTEHIVSTDVFGPFDIEAADVNGNGLVDIIVAGSTSHEIVWFRNTGGGVYGSKRNISSSILQPRAVAFADLTIDGLGDVVFTSEFFDRVDWRKNLGSGNFGGLITLSSSVDGAWDVTTADLDNDGDQDLISTGIFDDKVSWYENLGASSFAPKADISMGADNPRRIIAADFDNDGIQELVCASFNGDEVLVMENDGSGGFSGATSIGTMDGPYSIYPSDVDGDGDQDLLYASFNDDRISWIENTLIDLNICTTSVTFSTVYPTALDDSPENLIELSDGGYLTVGLTENYGVAGGSDILVMKFDCEGNQIWAKAVGDVLDDEGGDAVEVADGFLITGGITAPATGVKNLVVFKMSFDGNVVWTKTLATAEESEGQSMDRTLDDNFIIGGYVFESGNENSWILKVDGNGDTLWTTKFDIASALDRINWIAQRPSGGFYCTGRVKTGTPGVIEHGFVGKFDDNGDEIWIELLEDSTAVFDGTLSNSGGVVCVGRKRFPGNEFGVIATQLAPGGNTNWTSYFSDGSRDFAGSVIATDYGYIVGGRNRDDLSSTDRAWLLRLDESGDTINSALYEPLGADFFRDILIASDDDLVMVGIAANDFSSNINTWLLKTEDDGPPSCLPPTGMTSVGTLGGTANLSWTPAANHQGWQLKGGPAGGPFGTFVTGSSNISVGGLAPGSYEWRARSKCLGGEISDFSSINSFTIPTLRESSPGYAEVEVFPNPASTFVQLKAAAGFELATLKDLSGRTLATISMENGYAQLDLSSYEAGIYLLEFSGPASGFGSVTQKLYLE